GPIRHHVADRTRVERSLMVDDLTRREEFFGFTPADGLDALARQFMPAPRIVRDHCGERIRPDLVPAELPSRSELCAYPLIKDRRNATSWTRGDECIGHQSRPLAVTYEIVLVEQVEHRLQRLHHQAIGVEPHSAKPPKQKRADEIRPMRRMHPRQVDVAI